MGPLDALGMVEALASGTGVLASGVDALASGSALALEVALGPGSGGGSSCDALGVEAGTVAFAVGSLLALVAAGVLDILTIGAGALVAAGADVTARPVAVELAALAVFPLRPPGEELDSLELHPLAKAPKAPSSK